MHNRLARGVVAGAVGTVALNVATYADMTLRGRGSSGTPASLVGVLADKVGLTPLSMETKDEAAGNRRSGMGALLGYATGLGVGVAYGAVRGKGNGGSLPAGVAVGLAAMAASDVPIATSGVSDPSTWGAADWLSDVVPHLIYGLATVATYAALES